MDFVAKNQKIAKRASHIQKGEITPSSPLPSLVFMLLPMLMLILILIINTSVGPGSREKHLKSEVCVCRLSLAACHATCQQG